MVNKDLEVWKHLTAFSINEKIRISKGDMKGRTAVIVQDISSKKEEDLIEKN